MMHDVVVICLQSFHKHTQTKELTCPYCSAKPELFHVNETDVVCDVCKRKEPFDKVLMYVTTVVGPIDLENMVFENLVSYE